MQATGSSSSSKSGPAPTPASKFKTPGISRKGKTGSSISSSSKSHRPRATKKTSKDTTVLKKKKQAVDRNTIILSTAAPTPGYITVGGDCSGLECLALACERINLDHDLLFCSEKDGPTRRLLLENHTPRMCFKDVTLREPGEPPHVTLYGSGFPCQPYSSMGSHGGICDVRGGKVLNSVVGYITRKQPDAVLLENVAAFAGKKHKKSFNKLMRELRAIVGPAGCDLYQFQARVLDARDHCLPQSRRRLWIVGLKMQLMVKDFVWPTSLRPVKLATILEDQRFPDFQLPNTLKQGSRLAAAMQTIVDTKGGNPAADDWAIDYFASANRVSSTLDYTPCLTRARAGSGGFFITTRGRLTTTTEIFKLQGIDPQRITRTSVTDRQVRLAVGNGWPINVASRLIFKMMRALGKGGTSMCDLWANVARKKKKTIKTTVKKGGQCMSRLARRRFRVKRSLERLGLSKKSSAEAGPKHTGEQKARHMTICAFVVTCTCIHLVRTRTHTLKTAARKRKQEAPQVISTSMTYDLFVDCKQHSAIISHPSATTQTKRQRSSSNREWNAKGNGILSI